MTILIVQLERFIPFIPNIQEYIRWFSQLVVFLCFVFFLLLLVNIIHILIIKVLILLGFSLSFFSLLLILFILHFLLSILGNSPEVLSVLLGSFRVVSNDDVVEDSSGLHLPQVKTDLADLIKLGDGLGLVLVVLGVINLWVHPEIDNPEYNEDE